MNYIIKNTHDFSSMYINNFYNKIPDYKKEKITNIIEKSSKKKSIIGEILLNKLLKNNNIDYTSSNYCQNQYGKPYLTNHSIFFNISHSYDYIITITSHKEIGVDIEKIRKTSLSTINHFATKKEKEYILSSPHNIEERLFKIYTLKEAYFKMLGTNLNNILTIEFIINKDTINCSDKSVKVGFINSIEGYIIAYCEKA